MNFITNFFNDITNFFKSGSVLGVDIGTNSIKVVELSGGKGSFKLENYGIIRAKDYLIHSNKAIQNSSLSIVEDEASRLLKILLKEMKTKGKVALVSIPTFTSFVTLIDMPALSEKETTQSIGFQAKQYIPMPLNQVSVDWTKIDEYVNKENQKMQKILLVGIPQTVINSFKKVCKNAGLNLTALELDAMAMTRAFVGTDKPLMVVDIGAGSTLTTVMEGGVVKYVGQTDYSGVHITKAVSKSLDLSMLRAEELKIRRGLGGEKEESELSSLILPFLDVIIQEIEYTKGLYENRYGKKVENLSLTGGGAKLKGIEKYFSSRMNMTLSSPSTFVSINHNTGLEPAIPGLEKELPIAVGLAKRYFIS
ncbi:MAG: type IV pilus assembly protein PilM [Candidatus Paceibacterota bacterium]